MNGITYPPDISDSELIEKVKSHGAEAEEALKELIDRHTPLCMKIYNGFYTIFQRSGINYNDILAEKDYVIYDAALNYDESKTNKNGQTSKFSSWLYNQVRYSCLNQSQKKELKHKVSLEDFKDEVIQMEFHHKPDQDLEDKEKIDFINTSLDSFDDERIGKILKLRSQGTKWQDIAKEMNLSSFHCRNLYDRGLKLLKNKVLTEFE